MTIYVSSPRKNGNGYKRPERMHETYQHGGAMFETGDIHNLMREYPDSIYFTDDPDKDFGQPVINLDDYVVQSVGEHFEFTYQPTNELLITTMVASLETLTWRAQQHHLGVKDPRR